MKFKICQNLYSSKNIKFVEKKKNLCKANNRTLKCNS